MTPSVDTTRMETDDPSAKKKDARTYDDLDAAIERQKEVAAQGKLSIALEELLNLEKKERLAVDITGTKKTIFAILDCCYQANDWTMLNEHIKILSKKRAQLKQAVADMVRYSIKYLDLTPDLATKIELIKTLCNVTEGKIYVEIERARLVKMHAKYVESMGNVTEARDIMQAVAVETYGQMAKTEKIAFILEQVRLCLDSGDFIRAAILAKKISTRAFDREDTDDLGNKKKKEEAFEEAAPGTPALHELKVIYYQLMIRYHVHSNDHLEVARCYLALYQDKRVASEPSIFLGFLKKICWFIVLSPHGSMQSSLLHQTAVDKNLEELPEHASLLKRFITQELIDWPLFEQEYSEEMMAEGDIFGGEGGEACRGDLKLRVVEHNIHVVAKYYSRITLQKLAKLLDLPDDESEKHLCSLIVSKALVAKIDRPAGIVTFVPKKDTGEILNKWSRNITNLLALVEKSCHLIQKEAMQYKVTI